MAKLAHDETTLATDIVIPLPENVSELESMTIDSRGSFHIILAEVREDLHIGPGPARRGQPVLHYAVLDDMGRLSREERRAIHLPVTAAFIVENGGICVVSGRALLQPAQPTLASNPPILLFALVLCVCFMGGMATEAGSYVLVRGRSLGQP